VTIEVVKGYFEDVRGEALPLNLDAAGRVWLTCSRCDGCAPFEVTKASLTEAFWLGWRRIHVPGAARRDRELLCPTCLETHVARASGERP
jgi:hypothetical protein